VPIDRRDASVVEDLYDAYGASCYRLAHRMLGEEQLACTIVRNVFVAVWSGDAVFDPARGSVQKWLLRATHASAVTALRHQRHLGSGLVDSDQLGVPPKPDTVQRYLLELAYFGGYDETEIATLTGTTSSIVKTLTLQALRAKRTRPSTPRPRQASPVRALEVIGD
jgi:RNA polymerase sigma-70 factor (ECF subfamily)